MPTIQKKQHTYARRNSLCGHTQPIGVGHTIRNSIDRLGDQVHSGTKIWHGKVNRPNSKQQTTTYLCTFQSTLHPCPHHTVIFSRRQKTMVEDLQKTLQFWMSGKTSVGQLVENREYTFTTATTTPVNTSFPYCPTFGFEKCLPETCF